MLSTFAEYRAQPDFGCRLTHGWDSWLHAYSRHRDSDILTRSNWEVMSAALQKECGDECGDPDDADDDGQWAIFRFNHWACGWVEQLFTRPGSRAAALAEDWAKRMEDYPVLDEDHWSGMEHDEYGEAWGNWGAADFRREIKRKFALESAAAVIDWLDDIPTDDELRELYESLRTNGEYYTFDNSGCNLHTRAAAADLSRDQLARFVVRVRKARQAA